MDNRLGKIYFSDALVGNVDSWQNMRRIMGLLIPIRVEHLAYRGQYEYYCLSTLFEPVPEFTQIPEYDVVVYQDGRVHFTKRPGGRGITPSPTVRAERPEAMPKIVIDGTKLASAVKKLQAGKAQAKPKSPGKRKRTGKRAKGGK